MPSRSYPQPPLSRLPHRYDVRSRDYRFIQRSNGFRIEHPMRPIVDVRATPASFVVSSPREAKRVDFLLPPLKLCRMVAGLLLDASPRRPSVEQLTRETWAIAAPVHRLREDLMARVSPAHLKLQRTMSQMLGRVPDLVRYEALYRDPYVVSDVLRYRAAAIALAHLAARHEDGRSTPDEEPEIDRAAREMSNWRGLFSPDGVPYRSLNRTLMNLPDEVPGSILPGLGRVRLERPIVSAVELTTLLLFISRYENPRVVPAERLSVFQRATEGEIVAALARVGEETGRDLSARRNDDLKFFLDYLADYPGAEAASLRNLVGRAVRWHEEVRRQREERAQATRLPAGLTTDTPTARPPIPLPRSKGVRFLATVGQVLAEGRQMQHCIASYAEKAVCGECFLFHAEHSGEKASFEVDRKGRVRQAVGPGNGDNEAVRWGKQRLQRWAAGFYAPRPKRRKRPCPEQLTLPFGQPIGLAPNLDG